MDTIRYFSQSIFGNLPTAVNNSESDPYKPSVSDVLVVKAFLCASHTLPLELIDTIIDAAEYWPHTTTTRSTQVQIHGNSNDSNQLVVRLYSQLLIL